MRKAVALLVVGFISGSAMAAAAPPAHPDLAQAVAGSWRTPAKAARDPARHPVQALSFFGIKPTMRVVELEPAGGWWTEILAPYLATDGQLIEAIPPAGSQSAFARKMRTRFMAKLKANPAVYGHVDTVAFAPPDQLDLGRANSVDAVLTFRNLHDWLNDDNGSVKAVFAAAYKVLKPGGVFGVVSHRALPSANPKHSAKALHRLPEDYVIQTALNAGFNLDAVSQINANPKDPMTVNVHHLPPNLSNDTPAEKKRYRAVGESDRMTLRFVKPASSD